MAEDIAGGGAACGERKLANLTDLRGIPFQKASGRYLPGTVASEVYAGDHLHIEVKERE